MRRIVYGLIGVAWILVPIGCQGDPDASPDETPSVSGEASPESEAPVEVSSFVPLGVSGELIVTDDEFRFRPCDGAEWWTVVDGTGGELARIPERLESGERPVYAHLVFARSDGEEDAQPGREGARPGEEGAQPARGGPGAEVSEIRSAFPEGWGCPDVLPDTEVQARGNEPFWGVDIDGGTARFRTPDEIDGIEYTAGAWRETTDGWRFEAERDFVDGIAYLTVEITEERCYDSMSGAWYPFASRVSEGGTDYRGCALEGRRAGDLTSRTAPGG